MLPDILKQVGPQQYGVIKDLMSDQLKGVGAKGGAAGEEDEDDEVPPLVEGTFDAPAK